MKKKSKSADRFYQTFKYVVPSHLPKSTFGFRKSKTARKHAVKKKKFEIEIRPQKVFIDISMNKNDHFVVEMKTDPCVTGLE